jgi:hypothetical protein
VSDGLEPIRAALRELDRLERWLAPVRGDRPSVAKAGWTALGRIEVTVPFDHPPRYRWTADPDLR